MKPMQLFNFLLLPLIVIRFSAPPAEPVSRTLGTFEGTSLCAEIARPLLNIPANAQCDRIKWSLTLNVDPGTQSPTTYTLNSEYGHHVDNRTFVINGSNRRVGKWAIVTRAPSDPTTSIYHLEPSNRTVSILFQQIDPNLIHLLDQDRKLMVGDAAQSFTLSRVDRGGPGPVMRRLPVGTTRESHSKMPGSTVVGVFTGRSPCREVAQQLHHPVGADCNKLKWQITLFQDPVTLLPTNFKLRGTLFRDFDREGQWTIRSRPGNPDSVVYKLKVDKVDGSLFLLRADENILFFVNDDGNLMVGNRDFSYTLNRAE